MQTKVFITGGGGFVGREILWRLHEAGHAIRLLSRHPDSAATRQLAYRHKAEIVDGSSMDQAALVNGLQDCTAVIHLIGIIAEAGDNTFEKAHVETTRHMLSAAQSAGVRRFLHMSALGTRPDARARYHQTKWRAEELVRQSDLDWTIFRPSVIYGRDDGFVNLLAGLSRFSPFHPIIGTGTNRLQPVSVEQVAQCFVRALTVPETVGRTIDLCGREVFTLNELTDVILESARRRRIKLHLPMGLARVQAGLMESLFGLAGKASPLTRDQLRMIEEDNTGDPQPAEELLGLTAESFRDGIARYLGPS